MPISLAIEPAYIFAQDQDANLKFSCTNENGYPCESTYACNITVQYPNGTLLIDNQEATRNPSYYNITLPDTSTLGFHQYQSFCHNATKAGTSDELYFLVNLTGEEFTTGKAVLYIFVLIISVVGFLLVLYGAIRLPWDNRRDDEGMVVSMNDLKYVKLFLWFFAYIMLLFISFLTANVTKFLQMGVASGFFDFVHLFLLVFTFPIFVIVVVTGIVRFFNDKKTYALIERNIRVR